MNQPARFDAARLGKLDQLLWIRLQFHARARRIDFANLPKDFVNRFALPGLHVKRQPARQHFVEDHAERVDVCAGVDILNI